MYILMIFMVRSSSGTFYKTTWNLQKKSHTGHYFHFSLQKSHEKI